MVQDTVSAVQDSVVAVAADSAVAGWVIAIGGLVVVAAVLKLLFFTKDAPGEPVNGGGGGTDETGGGEAEVSDLAKTGDRAKSSDESFGGGVGGTVTEF